VFVRTLILLCLIVGCAHAPVDLGSADRSFSASDYTTALVNWSRKGAVYKNLESRLFLHATLRSWAFRQAQLAYRIDAERITANEAATLKASERAEAEKWYEFFVAAHTHEWQWNRLENRSKDSLWRIRLINDKGVGVAPTTVNRIGTNDPRYQAMYPYYKAFYVGYRVRFPKTDGQGNPLAVPGSRLTMRISGAPATIDLQWTAAK
jgi:hypothetical protein